MPAEVDYGMSMDLARASDLTREAARILESYTLKTSVPEPRDLERDAQMLMRMAERLTDMRRHAVQLARRFKAEKKARDLAMAALRA